MSEADGVDGDKLLDRPGLPRLILAALEQTRASACVTTADLDAPGPRIVYVNPAYAAMTGRAREDVIGETPRLMQGPLTDRRVLDRLRADLVAGRSFNGETVNYRADGSPFIINWSIDPVRNASGLITHFVATQEDVTEQVRLANLLAAEQSLDLALRAELTDAVDTETAFGALAEVVRSGLATIVPLGSPSVSLRDDTVPLEVSAGGRVGSGDVVEESFARAESGVRGALVVDGLTADEAVFVDRAGVERYSRRVASVAAAMAEYHRQRRAALRLQADLLPPDELAIGGFEIVTRYLPGSVGLNVGGDWFDAHDLGDRAVFSVGDVSGSGVEAALLMGRLRTAARDEFARGADGGAVMRALDQLCAADEQMATLLIVEAFPNEDRMRVWSAGHLPPLVLGGDGPRIEPVRSAPPLGYLTGDVRCADAAFGPGTGVMLYTDGLVERRHQTLKTSLDRLPTLIDGAAALDTAIDEMLAVVDAEVEDDVAIIAVRRR
ncbi:MAG: SpoIIE family protein phosphatase [Actinomycetota bacterium]